jgi:hypothetical protein
MIKICKLCGRNFKLKRSHSLYCSLVCLKKSEKILAKNWRINNPEKCKIFRHKYYLKYKKRILAYTKKYIKKHPEIRKICYKNYYKRHKKKELQRLRKWKKENKKRVLAMNKKWKINNPEKLRLYSIKRKIKEGKVELTENEWKKILLNYKNRCIYCSCKLYSKKDKNYNIKNLRTIDHKRSINKGGKTVKENIVPACLSCNSSKQDLAYKQFLIYRQKVRIDEE